MGQLPNAQVRGPTTQAVVRQLRKSKRRREFENCTWSWSNHEAFVSKADPSCQHCEGRGAVPNPNLSSSWKLCPKCWTRRMADSDSGTTEVPID